MKHEEVSNYLWDGNINTATQYAQMHTVFNRVYRETNGRMFQTFVGIYTEGTYVQYIPQQYVLRTAYCILLSSVQHCSSVI